MSSSSRKQKLLAESEQQQEEEEELDSDYACYEPNLSKEELKKVLDYAKKNEGHDDEYLPGKECMKAEIRRFDPTVSERVLKKAGFDDLIGMLYRAMGFEPRERSQAKQYHRFGLSFEYTGEFPLPIYRKGMSRDDLKAMLELYPDPEISAAEMMRQLRELGAKRVGDRAELLQRLREYLGCVDIQRASHRAYTSVPCWEDEQEALQAKFDAERRAWQLEIDSVEQNSKYFRQAESDRQALLDKAKAEHKKRKRKAASRPWCAKPYHVIYDPKKPIKKNAKTREQLESEWKARYPKLSFAYSGARMPEPPDFQDILEDYLDSPMRNAHHMLAYLEQGHGEFDISRRGCRWDCQHAYMTIQGLQNIHRRRCLTLVNSHHKAVEVLRHRVQMSKEYRFQHGI